VLPDPADIGLFSDVVRAARAQLNLSQNDLAAGVCMVSRPTITGNDIARYERGKRIARAEIRRALEEVLGLPTLTLDIAAANQKAARHADTDGPLVGLPGLAVGVDPIGRIPIEVWRSPPYELVGTKPHEFAHRRVRVEHVSSVWPRDDERDRGNVG
jgi:transcriptional regulator with XRE-family HTH domain